MPLNRARSSSSSRRRWRMVAFFPWVLVLGWAGCGTGQYSGPVYPVEGQVVLANGKPLTGGAVQFIPKEGGMLAFGKIDRDGKFSLVSLDQRQGAAPGEYKVRIEPSAEM